MAEHKYLHHKHRTNNKKMLIKSIDSLCMYMAVIMPLTTIPQIVQLYTTKDATGLSLLMWVLYTIGILPFLAYGILHKVKQLIVLEILWLIVQAVIIIGIIMYS